MDRRSSAESNHELFGVPFHSQTSRYEMVRHRRQHRLSSPPPSTQTPFLTEYSCTTDHPGLAALFSAPFPLASPQCLEKRNHRWPVDGKDRQGGSGYIILDSLGYCSERARHCQAIHKGTSCKPPWRAIIIYMHSVPTPQADESVTRDVHNQRALLHPHITRMREVRTRCFGDDDPDGPCRRSSWGSCRLTLSWISRQGEIWLTTPTSSPHCPSAMHATSYSSWSSPSISATGAGSVWATSVWTTSP